MRRLFFSLSLVGLTASALLAQPDPASVYAWYKADSGAVTNLAGSVTNWQNQALSGTPSTRDLNTYGAPPLWIANAGGAMPAVRFSGVNNIFAIAGKFGTVTTNRTLAFCLRLTGTNDGFLFDGASNSGLTRSQVRSGSWQVGLQPNGGGANADTPTLPILPGSWQVHFFNFEPLDAGTRVRHSQFNGASSTYTNSTSTGLSGLILGQNVSQAQGLAVNIAEVLVYDRSLTADEQQSVGSYLTNKWPATSAQPPAAASAYAWYAGDTSLSVGADSYSVTTWRNMGTAGTNATYTQAKRNLSRIVGSPQKLWLRFPDGSPAAAVNFDGTDGAWAAQSDFGAITSDRSVVALVRVSNAAPQGFLFDSTSYTTGLTRAQVRDGNWQVSVYGASANAYASAAGTITAPATTNLWQVHSFIVTTNPASLTFRHYTNGTLAGLVTNSVPGALGGFMIGMNASAAVGIRADVAEVLVFNSALDDATRGGVENYLAVKWAGVVPDPNPPTPPANDFVRVFAAGDAYTCYRIPGIVTTARGTLIAVSDGRIGSCGDIPTPLDLVCKRSFDNGNTWGPLQVIADYGSNPSDVDTYPFYGVTNISRVSAGDAALLLDRTNGRVWTLYDNGGVLSGSREIKLEMRYSDDDGATWSTAVDLEAQNPGIRPSYGEFLAGPGNGIQLTEGTNSGRLIFPVYTYGSPSASMVIYSDDHGATWQRGASITYGGEIQVAETPGGGLIASMRDNGFSWSGVRTFSRSADGGLTWGPPFTNTTNPPSIPDPQCQGNIYRLTTTNDSNASRLIHANAANASSRVNMTLRISYDEGATWAVSNQVYAGGSAYSSVTKLATGEIGLLFEKDPYGSLDYVRRSVSQITGGADSLPPYTVWAGSQFTPAQLMDPATSGPDADPDGDGYSNYAEFTAGTNPLNPASHLQLRVSPAQTNAVLNFDGVSNKTYTVQYRGLAEAGGWQRLADVGPLLSNTVVAIPLAPTNSSAYFRLATPRLL